MQLDATEPYDKRFSLTWGFTTNPITGALTTPCEKPVEGLVLTVQVM